MMKSTLNEKLKHLLILNIIKLSSTSSISTLWFSSHKMKPTDPKACMEINMTHIVLIILKRWKHITCHIQSSGSKNFTPSTSRKRFSKYLDFNSIGNFDEQWCIDLKTHAKEEKKNISCKKNVIVEWIHSMWLNHNMKVFFDSIWGWDICSTYNCSSCIEPKDPPPCMFSCYGRLSSLKPNLWILWYIITSIYPFRTTKGSTCCKLQYT